MFEIKPIKGKGKGVLATQAIPRGTLIMAETPVVRVRANFTSAQAQQAYASLTPANKIIVDSMKSPVGDGMHGLIRSHAIPLGDQAEWGALFANVCFANHSCVPNANYYWDERQGKEMLHALMDIQKDEEIMVSYITAETTDARKQILSSKFGFNCLCPLCVRPPAERDASDKRRLEYTKLVDFFPSAMQKEPVSALALLTRSIHLLAEEGLWSDLAVRYYDGFQTCAAWGDLQNSKKWASEAKKAQAITRGTQAEDTKQMAEAEKNPRSHRLWAILGRKQLNGPPLVSPPTKFV